MARWHKQSRWVRLRSVQERHIYGTTKGSFAKRKPSSRKLELHEVIAKLKARKTEAA